MEPTDTAIPAAPPSRRGSQTQIPRTLLWIAAAAVLLRIALVVADRPKAGGGGLVAWKPVADAGSLSQTAGKPILYDFTAAWCVPCHRLDSEAWGDASTAKRVADRFVPARIVDRQREDGRNTPPIEELEQRFRVEAFPTLIIADASGKEVARMEGYGGLDRLEQFLAGAAKKAAGGN